MRAMDARLRKRVQRYGWDLAAPLYERHWQGALRPAQAAALALARLHAGEDVIDVASGTGIVAFSAADAVGPHGRVLGVDLSDQMVAAANHRAARSGLSNVRFERMDAERLDVPDRSFDAALCTLGLMYLPDPLEAVREARRVLRPDGRAVFAVWGEQAGCGWSGVLPIVDREVRSDVCPLFFDLGRGDALARLCADAGFRRVEQQRVRATLVFPDAEAACDAVLLAGPVALAWSRFDATTRTRVRAAYLASIARWQREDSYQLPGEFIVVAASDR